MRSDTIMCLPGRLVSASDFIRSLVSVAQRDSILRKNKVVGILGAGRVPRGRLVAKSCNRFHVPCRAIITLDAG